MKFFHRSHEVETPPADPRDIILEQIASLKRAKGTIIDNAKAYGWSPTDVGQNDRLSDQIAALKKKLEDLNAKDSLAA